MIKDILDILITEYNVRFEDGVLYMSKIPVKYFQLVKKLYKYEDVRNVIVE